MDTFWINPKIPDITQKGNVFKIFDNRNEPEIDLIKDTSKYALLYIYRSKKLTNALANYIVEINRIPALIMQNNSGFIVKIVKQGKLTINSRLGEDNSLAELNIEFGKKYFVKSIIHWTISKRWYNFELETKNVTSTMGEAEFELTKYKR